MTKIIHMNSNFNNVQKKQTVRQVNLNNNKQISDNLDKLYKESERRVSEYGNFSSVKTRFINKDKSLDVKTVELVIKPSILGNERPKERELEVVVYSKNERSKYSLVLKRGEKGELIKYLKDEELPSVIDNVINEASDAFSEM